MVVGGFLVLISSLPSPGAELPGVTSETLAPRSGPLGATLFATLPPEQTGIHAENRYADPRMWGDRYREFSLGAIGTGVAIGDYDNDGRPDIFVVGKSDPNRLFRNLGDWRFEDFTESAGLAGPTDAWQQGVAFVDVNNDGWLDLYVCRFAAPNLLYINQGDGTFVESAAAAGLDLNDASAMSAWADFDRDGWLDVYVQTNVLNSEARPNGQRDRLYRNNGDGTFTDVADAAGISEVTQGHSATWWDYDNDGWPDLYVANDFKDPDQLFHNTRDGKFRNVLSYVVPHTPQSSMGADLGDVNNDGLIDFLIADMAATTRYKDARGMAELRRGLAENFENPRAAPQTMRNALFLNTDTGRCLEAAFLTGLTATDWTWSVRFEDLDSDGWVDVHVTTGMVRELHNSDLVDRMLKLESMPARWRLMKASPRLDEANLAFRNRGDLRFEDIGAAWGLDHRGVSFGAAFGDLDGDGDLDLVFSNYEGHPTVCRNDSDSGNRVILALRGVTNRFGVGATVRIETASGIQVRQLVVARGYNSSSEPILHFGLGTDEVIDRLLVTWPDGLEQTLSALPANRRYIIHQPDSPVGTADPRDKPDIARPLPQFVEASREANLAFTSSEKPLDELAGQPLLPWRLNRLGPAVAIADLDGDGEDDVLIGGASGSPPQLARALNGGRFLPDLSFALDHPTTTADAGIVVFDANQNGHLDILVVKGGVSQPAGDAAYRPRLALNRGRSQFANAPADALPDLRQSAGPVAVADFDRDGRLDVFIGGRTIPGRYPETPSSVILKNQGGTFADVTAALAPEFANHGMVQAALATDVDGDGWCDLLIALEWGGVRFFRNDKGRRFEDWSERAGFAATGNGFWRSLAGADFNGDGRMDYVAGNLGLNTAYQASDAAPAILFYGAFDETDRPQIIEAIHDGPTLYPRRAREQILQVLPGLRSRFPTFESFARATLQEIFPPERLAQARRLEVTNLHSGIFLSQPDGSWRFTAFPRVAQIAPIQGIVTGDFDGNGHADVYVLQNSYAPIPESGRADGGVSQLLRGDGSGAFTAVPPAESGLIVPFDARAVAVFDPNGDGWPDFFVTRNNDHMLFFQNRGRDGAKSFAVTLRGPAGNPTMIGAKVTVALSDGRTQTSEIASGSGYLAQSSASLFFGYPTDNPPREIRVRWPDGTSNVFPWSNASARVTLTAPGP